MKTETKNQYWGSLEELEAHPEFLKQEQNEFPFELPLGEESSQKDKESFGRRDFLKMMGFSAAAVLASCSRMPVEKAIPYLRQPENIIPGKAFWYASTCAGCTAGCGILIKNREGRPIKVEGNPDSPVNTGGLCAVGQAGVLELYDSGRLHFPMISRKEVAWQTMDEELTAHFNNVLTDDKHIRFLTKSILSPSTKKIIDSYYDKYPHFEHITYDAVSASAIIQAHEKSFNKKVLPHFRFDQAQLIVSLGADFLGTWISPVEFAKAYVKNRKLDGGKTKMSQHIQFESRLSLTGSNADIRYPIKPSQEGVVALYLLDSVLQKLGKAGASPLPKADMSSLTESIQKTAGKLVKNQGRSLVVSSSNDVAVQTVIAKINYELENYGKAIDIDYPSNQKMHKPGEWQDTNNQK